MNEDKQVETEFLDDFGFTFEDEAPPTPDVYGLSASVAKLTEEVKKLQDAINPFLTNLARNPEKPIIRWENRAEQVTKFRKSINARFDRIEAARQEIVIGILQE